MTTKHKIIFGFVSMMIIMIAISIFGYRSLNDAQIGLDEYGQSARLNVRFSDALTSLNAAGAEVNTFMQTFGDETRANFHAALDALDSNVKAAQRDMEDTGEIESANRILGDVRAYREFADSLMRGLAELMTQYNTKVIPNNANVHKALKILLQAGHDANQNSLLLVVGRFEEEYASLVFNLGVFIRTRSEAEMEAAQESISKLTPLLASIKGAGGGLQIAEAYGDLLVATNTIFGSVEVIAHNGKAIAAALEAGRQARAGITKELGAISRKYDERMVETLAITLREILDGKVMLAVGSAVGVLLGLLLSLFIIYGLTRVLRSVSGFATAIAGGDFQAGVVSREKGEVGEMLKAIKQIPDALQAILAEYQALEKQVEVGGLDAKADSSAYCGGFATLVNGTNAILARFLHVLDNIPSPILVTGRELKLAYVNAATRAIYGKDCKGMLESKISGRVDAESPTDAMKKAVETLRPATAETCTSSGASGLEISYSAIPMQNQAGQLVAVLQVITDLTAIKQTQRIILGVAEQAASIANRVAAASEELSAQVEQVSRGADMQRCRVESTASAMEEMNATVLEVARNAGQASDQSEITRCKASDGAALVDRVVNSINLVDTVAATLQENMQELGTQTESIGGVINVISDIADQTNLLALNAAIEAARAGEAGRGFAVVADEVRKLAEKTMTSTQEVGVSVTAIQKSARANIREVNEAARAVTEAAELANTSGQALQEIVDLAAANSAVVTSIATAAEEQSATSEEINRAIDEINRIVADTADGMVQSAAAVQELSKMAQELNSVMAKLR